MSARGTNGTANGHRGHASSSSSSSSSASASAAAVPLNSLLTSKVDDAITSADPHRGLGTTYLHTDHPLTTSRRRLDEIESSNPTGGVVPSINLATTFRQRNPGEASCKGDPNSFGLGYEYGRT
ncbi:hypothetical protein ACHAWF_001306, partial [Thalassiosira exigua]